MGEPMRFSNFLQKTLDSFWQIARVTIEGRQQSAKKKSFSGQLHLAGD